MEDVEAQRSLVVSEEHLNWFLAAIVELVSGLEDRFFMKFGKLDHGRTKLSMFRSENGWVLCCNFWSALGGCSTIWVFSGDDKKGWLSFLQMLERFLSNLEYKKWFSSHCLPAQLSSQIQSLSCVDRVTSFGFTLLDKNKGFQCVSKGE